MTDIGTIREAAHEIRGLRRANELLAAQVGVIEVFRAALLGAPRGGGMSPDITWALDRMAEQAEAQEKARVKPKDITVFINGNSLVMSSGKTTYGELVELAGLTGDPTMVVSFGHAGSASRSVRRGDGVELDDGAHVEVVHTNSA